VTVWAASLVPDPGLIGSCSPLLFSSDPGGVTSFVSLVFGSVWISIIWNALLCALHRPRHRYRRCPTLSYNQRVLRLTSCVRSRPKRESRGYRNKSKYKSILGSSRRRRSRRKRAPSFNIRHRLKERLGEDFLHQVSCFKADSVSLSEFVLIIDPLEHFKRLESCSGLTVGGKLLYQESVLFQVSHPGLFSINPTRPNEPVVSTNSERDNNEDLPIVIDTGASWSVTPFLMDFVSSINESSLDSLHSLDGQYKYAEKGPSSGRYKTKWVCTNSSAHGLICSQGECSTVFPPNLLYGTQWWWDAMYSARNRLDLK
jgi:hypothetical protein